MEGGNGGRMGLGRGSSVALLEVDLMFKVLGL
jgi:hypothetical protein